MLLNEKQTATTNNNMPMTVLFQQDYVLIYGKYNFIYPYLPNFEIGGRHPSGYNSFLIIRLTSVPLYH